MTPHLIIMEKVVLLSALKKKKKWVSARHKWCPHLTIRLLVILRIFEENQNPVDMHTSIMCINILPHIKAVAPKLRDSQTNHASISGRTGVN
jgi:hypothetical protein